MTTPLVLRVIDRSEPEMRVIDTSEGAPLTGQMTGTP